MRYSQYRKYLTILPTSLIILLHSIISQAQNQVQDITGTWKGELHNSSGWVAYLDTYIINTGQNTYAGVNSLVWRKAGDNTPLTDPSIRKVKKLFKGTLNGTEFIFSEYDTIQVIPGTAFALSNGDYNLENNNGIFKLIPVNKSIQSYLIKTGSEFPEQYKTYFFKNDAVGQKKVSSQKNNASGWITIDSADFTMKYPSNWNVSTGNDGNTFIFSPKEFAAGEFDLHLSVIDMSSLYGKTYDKKTIRALELQLISNSVIRVNHGLSPDPIIDSVVDETLYKDFKLEKYIYENKDRKSETDIYTGNRTFSIGYSVSPKSLFSDYKQQIETILKSFELKLNGAALPNIAHERKITSAYSKMEKSDTKSEVEEKTVTPVSKPKDEEKIYDSKDVEIQPSFFGGEDGWKKFLRDSLRTDFLTENHVPKGKYTVIVSFVVNTSGPNSDVKALNDPGYGTAQEAVRVIKEGSWFHATKNGNGVRCRTKKSITFEVDE